MSSVLAVVGIIGLQFILFRAFAPEKPMFLVMTGIFLIAALALSPGKSLWRLLSRFGLMYLVPLGFLAIPVFTARGFEPGERVMLAITVGASFCLFKALSLRFYDRWYNRSKTP